MNDFEMDTVNGISHEALYAIATGYISAERIEQFENERRERECIRQHRVRAFKQGWMWGYTHDDQYRVKNHAIEAPEKDGIYSEFIRGYRGGVNKDNAEWLKGEMERICGNKHAST